MSDPPSRWLSIKAMAINFAMHSKQQYSTVHKKLEAVYSHDITEFDDIFTDETRTKLKDDAAKLVTEKVIATIAEQAHATTDKSIIKPLFNHISINCPRFERNGLVNLRHLDTALDDAAKMNKDYIQLSLGINQLYFYPDADFCPEDFTHISTTPLPTNGTPTTPAATGRDTVPQTPQQQLLNTLINALSPGSTGNNSSNDFDLGRLRQQEALLFKPDRLPDDVKARYLNAQTKDKLLTENDRKAFLTQTPNLTMDPSGSVARTSYYYLDSPHRLITRSGDLFYFSLWDAKEAKNFINRCPTPEANTYSPAIIRRWYMKFHQHAHAFGIYVHNYYDFRPNPSDLKGFTCGDDDDAKLHDLPAMYGIRLDAWGSLIHSALANVFTQASTQEYSIVANHHSAGYEALFALIRTSHPSYAIHKSSLLSDRPRQSRSQSIASYFNTYVDYMQLHAFLEGNTSNLDNAYELECFIGHLRDGQQYLVKTHDERRSSNTAILAKYKQNQIVITLESYAPLITPTRTATIARNSPSSTPLKRTTLKYDKSRSSSTPRGPRDKSINSVEFDDDNPFSVYHYDDGHNGQITTKYVSALKSSVYNSSFDINADPCLVCGASGHTFDDCPVLNDTQFLRKHYIGFCSFMKRTNRDKPTMPINSLQTDDDNMDESSQNDDEDFHSGQT